MKLPSLLVIFTLVLSAFSCTTTPDSNKTAEMNKAQIRLWLLEGDNKGKFEIADAVFAPDVVVYHPTSPEPLKGAETIKRSSKALQSSFPGFQGTIEDMVAEGDRVAVRWNLKGTHKGPFMGVPATNKSFSLPGISIYKFVDGKVVEAWYSVDMLKLFQQLGVVGPISPTKPNR